MVCISIRILLPQYENSDFWKKFQLTMRNSLMSHLEQVYRLLIKHDIIIGNMDTIIIVSVFYTGRHRCIGENFAFIQIKTIWSILLRKYEFDLVDGHFPPVNYTTMIHTPTKPIIRYKRRI